MLIYPDIAAQVHTDPGSASWGFHSPSGPQDWADFTFGLDFRGYGAGPLSDEAETIYVHYQDSDVPVGATFVPHVRCSFSSSDDIDYAYVQFITLDYLSPSPAELRDSPSKGRVVRSPNSSDSSGKIWVSGTEPDADIPGLSVSGIKDSSLRSLLIRPNGVWLKFWVWGQSDTSVGVLTSAAANALEYLTPDAVEGSGAGGWTVGSRDG